MTHAEHIIRAVASLVSRGGHEIITRDQIRQRLWLSREDWMASYTSIFQSMRADQPGGAPDVPHSTEAYSVRWSTASTH